MTVRERVHRIRCPRTVVRRDLVRQRGFTFIELLVVLAVIAILAAIVVFNIAAVGNRGNSASCATDTHTLQTAVDSYLNDNPSSSPSPENPLPSAGGTWWPLLVPRYIHTVPTVSECKTTPMGITFANGVDGSGGYSAVGA